MSAIAFAHLDFVERVVSKRRARRVRFCPGIGDRAKIIRIRLYKSERIAIGISSLHFDANIYCRGDSEMEISRVGVKCEYV